MWYNECLLTMYKALGLILNISKKRLKVDQSTLYNMWKYNIVLYNEYIPIEERGRGKARLGSLITGNSAG